MFESFSVSIRVVSSFILGEAPGGIYLWGLLFVLGGVPFFSLVWAKKRSKRNSTATGWTHASSVLCPPPPFGRWFALLGALLYASRWRTQESSIGRLWGGEAPQSRGYHSTPQSRVRGGAFFCGRKPPLPPKKPLRISPQLITLW